jgi:hypothetical protein
MKIAAPLLLIYLTIATFAQIPANSGSQMPFALVERIGELKARSFFVISKGDLTFAIRQDGLGDTTSTRFIRDRVFRLQMGGGILERLYTADFGGDMVFAYEVIGGSGRGYVARFDPNKRIFRWFAPIPAKNIGPGLIEDNYAYITGADFVAKIDLQTGKYVWQHADLKKESGSTFREFDLPEVNGSRVVFRERMDDGRSLQMDKASGAVMKSESSPR